MHLSARAPAAILQFAGGEPSHNLLKVVRPELRIELRTALYQAAAAADQRRDRRACASDSTTSRRLTVNLIVRPVLRDDDPARGFFLVSSRKPAEATGARRAADDARSRRSESAQQLEEELVRLKSQLRTTIEQYETQAEELKASNEELQAINEELRSATEELETSKEELQSVNEELSTVNQELKIKIDEQAQATNDIQNLINSTDIGTVFLDRPAHQAVHAAGAGHLQPDSERSRPAARGHQQPPGRRRPVRGRRARARPAGASRARGVHARRPLAPDAHGALPHVRRPDRRRGADLRRHHGAQAGCGAAGRVGATAATGAGNGHGRRVVLRHRRPRHQDATRRSFGSAALSGRTWRLATCAGKTWRCPRSGPTSSARSRNCAAAAACAVRARVPCALRRAVVGACHRHPAERHRGRESSSSTSPTAIWRCEEACKRTTGARTSSWPPWPTNCGIRWRRLPPALRGAPPLGSRRWTGRPCAREVHGAAGPAHDSAGRGSAGGVADHARQDRTAARAVGSGAHPAHGDRELARQPSEPASRR